MEERKQMSNMERNGILSELGRTGHSEEEIALVKDDLSFGISKEDTERYTKKKLDIKQMKVYSQCLRNGYAEEVIQVITQDGMNGFQMEILLEFYEKGVPIETIKQIAVNGDLPAIMRHAFQKILEELHKSEAAVQDEPEYVKQLVAEIKGVVSKIEFQDKRYDELNDKLKVFENTKKDEEVKDNLLNTLSEKDVMLADQQDKINQANSTIAKLRNEMEALREEKKKMDARVEELENQRKIQSVADTKPVVREETAVPEAKLKEVTADTVSVAEPFSQVKVIYGMPAYYAPIHDGNGNVVQTLPLERTSRKSNGCLAAMSKMLFKKKSRQDIVKLVASGELVPAQLIQVRSAIEKGLTEGQLLELINNKIPAEQMKEIIEIAVLENSLEI